MWRIEWQARKDWLRRFGIITFADLEDRQGDLLQLLVNDHTTLRTQTEDSNRSRWPLHPLWQNLVEQVATLNGLGEMRELDQAGLLDERLSRISISIYGYLKRVAAIDCLKTGQEKAYLDEAFERLQRLVNEIHDPLTWHGDVGRRVTEMRLGEW